MSGPLGVALCGVALVVVALLWFGQGLLYLLYVHLALLKRSKDPGRAGTPKE